MRLSKGIKGTHFLLTGLSTSAGNLITDLEKLILGSPQGLQASLTPASPSLPPTAFVVAPSTCSLCGGESTIGQQ